MSSPQFVCPIDSPLGRLQAWSSPAGLTRLVFVEDGALSDDPAQTRAGIPRAAPALPGDPHGLKPALSAWLAGDFDALDHLPLDVAGMPFQLEVWARLRALPPGRTTTYGALAGQMGQRGGARAVGGALGRNPVAIVIPCHRVIGADGGLVDYAWGLPRKRWLLEHEGALQPEAQGALFG